MPETVRSAFHRLYRHLIGRRFALAVDRHADAADALDAALKELLRK